jgi:uncharacterized membrane protein
MNKRLPLLLRHIMYNLRGGFLVRPLIIALLLGGAGAVLSWLEETHPTLSAWVPALLFPSHSDPQVAQVILAGIAGSIMTVVSIVFAILLMTLTLASMQFSPRIIVSFVRDRVTQWTLGIFLGTFCYCMAALPAARSAPKPFAPVVTVLGAMLLSLICVSWLLFFIHHISQAINVNQIVDRIASETVAMIDEMMPHARRYPRADTVNPMDSSTWETTIRCETSGYIRYIDTGRLLDIARSHRVKVDVLRRVGQFVPEGVPFLKVYKGERLTAEGAAELRNAFDFGPSRTLQQDIEFGVLQIVDIALKAISPAVNDPSTAITCVDQLSRVLIRFAAREAPSPLLCDTAGVARVSIMWSNFGRMLDSAFEQIRLYSQTDLAVSLRMMRALGDIATTLPDPADCRTLVERGRRIVEGCAQKLGEQEMKELRARQAGLEQFLPATPPPPAGKSGGWSI